MDVEAQLTTLMAERGLVYPAQCHCFLYIYTRTHDYMPPRGGGQEERKHKIIAARLCEKISLIINKLIRVHVMYISATV